MSKAFTLKPEEAAIILKTNAANVDAQTKRLLQKVVDKRPLSEEEIGALEGIAANEELKRREGTLAPDATTPDAEITKKEFLRAESESETIARRQLVLEMRTQHPPVPIRDIAKRLGIATATVQRDIVAIREKNTRVLSQNLGVAMLGQTVQQYDILYGKAMALGDQYTSPMAKAAFLRTAISALDSKAKLMGDTGIIHRVPQQSEILVAHADAGTVRDRVARLIRAQDERKAPTIELPAADRPLIDPDLTEAESPQPDAETS